MMAPSNLRSQPVVNASNQTQSNTQPVADEPRFKQLQRALVQGWVIESPIYLRTQWFTGNITKEGYYCILKREKDVDLIVVPDSSEMRQFVKERRLKVVAA